MLVPVTVEDFRAWFLEPDAEVAPRDLARADAEVALWLRSAVYTTDKDGYPVDPEVRRAVIGAICEQARAHQLSAEATQTASAASPLGRPLQSASIDGVSWTASGESSVPANYAISGGGLCQEALTFLAFLPRRVSLYG